MSVQIKSRLSNQIQAARRSSAQKQTILDVQTQRTAKRIMKQQRRLERDVGITNVYDLGTAPRQKMVRYQDIIELEPLTDTQANFWDSYDRDGGEAFVLYGSAGTGKTFIACYKALLDVMDPDDETYQKIIIIRSAVQSRDQGFLPGDLAEKMAAYEQPYVSIFGDLTRNRGAYEKLKDMGKIEFMSSSFLRGSTFNNAIVIVDEFQSTNWHELKTICTRVGRDTKIIFCGDGAQDDLNKSKHDVSGFREFIEVSKQMPTFRNFRFTEDDIVRSGFVRDFIVTCNRLGL
jgi:phosphate starvation-inducible protein PhoH and related proteins